MNRSFDIDHATAWIDLAARVTRLPATDLLKRLREGDDALTDAITAILSAELKPGQRLDAVRDFLVQHSLGEAWNPATDVLPSQHPETSPFQVPARFLDLWFPEPQTPEEYERPIKTLMRVRRLYDSVELKPDIPQSWRLFGNSNVGHAMRCNLQVPGQLTCDDTPFLITSWWVTTTTWPRIDEYFSKTAFTLMIEDRHEALTPGLDLWRGRQTLLVPVPPRTNFSVQFDHYSVDPETRPAYAPPLYVMIEGWGRRVQPR